MGIRDFLQILATFLPPSTFPLKILIHSLVIHQHPHFNKAICRPLELGKLSADCGQSEYRKYIQQTRHSSQEMQEKYVSNLIFIFYHEAIKITHDVLHYYLEVQANPKKCTAQKTRCYFQHLWEKQDYPMTFLLNSQLGLSRSLRLNDLR